MLAATLALVCAFAGVLPAAAAVTVPAPVASAPLASLPLRRDTVREGDTGGWFPAGAAVALLVGAAAWAASRRWPWRAAGPAHPPPGLVRVASQSLTAQASVHAIRWNGEEILVACSAQQVTVLARQPAPGGEAT